MKRSLKADGALVLVTITWGITFPVILNSVRFTDPFWFVVMRALIASLVLLPFVFKQLFKSNRRLIIAGIWLGLFNGGTYVCQSIGLETISSASSAFITGTSVVIVPLLLPFFGLGLPRRIDIAGCFLALIGLYILTGANLHDISLGELWTLGGALFYAFTIVYLQRASSQTSEITLLTFYQIFFVIPWALS